MNLFVFVRSAHSCIIERLPEYDNILFKSLFFVSKLHLYDPIYLYQVMKIVYCHAGGPRIYFKIDH